MADVYKEIIAGQKLTPSQVSDLEAKVEKDPTDMNSRLKLLGYYSSRQYGPGDARQARLKHIYWIIENQPEAEVAGLPYSRIDPISNEEAYAKAKQLWLDQVNRHSDSAVIVGNAAHFFEISDNAEAERLLKQAQKLEPANPKWSENLGQLYSREVKLPGKKDSKVNPKKNAATKSLEQFERAQASDNSAEGRFYRLDNLAKAAFEAGEFDKATKYSNELLQEAANYPKDWNYGNAIHHGNSVLGRIALKEGDFSEAIKRLLQAGQTPGSPQLDSFGPNMNLAKELIEKGEKKSVLAYFELCKKFWKLHGDKLDVWTQEVNEGKVPDFGGNLLY